MRSPDEWLAEFARRGEQFRAAASAFHRHVGGLGGAVEAVPARPVVLEPARDVRRSDQDLPRSASGLLDLAHSLGWSGRLVASAAAHPSKGYVEVVTLRFRRHDERGFAAWWNGAYECGWYVGPDGLEPLAGTPMSTRASAAATRAAKALAAGKPEPAAVPMIRGVRDALEGIRLTRHDVVMADGVI